MTKKKEESKEQFAIHWFQDGEYKTKLFDSEDAARVAAEKKRVKGWKTKGNKAKGTKGIKKTPKAKYSRVV